MAGEVVAGYLASSLALIADAGHMLTDAISIVAVIWTTSLARRPATARWTFGLSRAEIVAAAINGISLLVVAGLIVQAAIEHLISPPQTDGTSVIILASIGIVINLIVVWLLGEVKRGSLNAKAAFVHVTTDLAAFVGTLVAGIVIVTTAFSRADAVASLGVAGLIIWASFGLLRDSARVLLEGVPEEVDIKQVRSHIVAIPGVLDVHDLHAWTLSTRRPVVSAHVVVSDVSFKDGSAGQVLDQLQDCLGDHFDVAHSTFQLEPGSHQAHEAEFHS